MRSLSSGLGLQMQFKAAWLVKQNFVRIAVCLVQYVFLKVIFSKRALTAQSIVRGVAKTTFEYVWQLRFFLVQTKYILEMFYLNQRTKYAKVNNKKITYRN